MKKRISRFSWFMRTNLTALDNIVIILSFSIVCFLGAAVCNAGMIGTDPNGPGGTYTGFGSMEAYRGQTFRLPSGASVLANKLTVYVGPTSDQGASFHVLLTELDMTAGFHPTTVIYESATLNVPVLPVRRGSDVFTLELGGLLLKPGRDYAWILDHFVVGTLGTFVSMSTGLGSYPDGRAFSFLGFPAGTRDDHFASNNWFIRDDRDFAFQLEFTELPKDISGVKFWSMNVGNHWVYDGADSGGATWTARNEVVGIDTTTIPGVNTFKVEARQNGILVGYQWYSTSLAELTEQRETMLGDIGFGQEWITLAYDSGLVWAKNPIIIGDHWVTQTTATLSGSTGWSFPVSISLDMTIQSQEFITVPLGTYKAYKFQQILHFWNASYGIDETDTQYGWFIPYLGLARSQDSLGGVESLSSLSIRKEIIDLDSDAKTDIAVYRASTGVWYVKPSSGSPPYGVGWGGDPNDKPVPGDYDGDGKTDYAVYRTSTGAWWIIPSSTSTPYGVGWGGDATDKPVPADYDGDGKTDIAVYRGSNGGWYIIPSSAQGTPLGVGWGGDASDKPVPGDYDGDGKTDIAVYRGSNGGWYIIPSSAPGNPLGVGWGGDASDKPVPGDYDGDGKTDIAVYRASNGGWYVYPSGGGPLYGLGWGGDGTDVPVTLNAN